MSFAASLPGRAAPEAENEEGSTAADLYRARFVRAHLISFGAAVYAVVAAGVYVFARLSSGHSPVPLVTHQELTTAADYDLCDCRCRGGGGGGGPGEEESDQLLCSIAQDAEHVGDAAGSRFCDERLLDEHGAGYVGCQNWTATGRPCQRWDAHLGREHWMAGQLQAGLLPENYCRNPDGKLTVWCYTTDPAVPWEFCEPRRLWYAGDAPEVAGCLSGEVLKTHVGPPGQVLNCSCSPPGSPDEKEPFLCSVEFAFSSASMRWVAGTSVLMWFTALAALLLDAQHLFAIYAYALPGIPDEAVSPAWVARWLKGYQDPFHVVTLWVVWGMVLGLGCSLPYELQGPFPMLRDWSPPDVRRTVGLKPTGGDELALWLGIVALVMAGLFLLGATPVSALDGGPVAPSGGGVAPGGSTLPGHADAASPTSAVATELGEAPRSAVAARAGVAMILCLASTGFVMTAPIKMGFAVLLTLPIFFLVASQAAKSPWPLERPFPGFALDAWKLPESQAAKLENALAVLSGIETAASISGSISVASAVAMSTETPGGAQRLGLPAIAEIMGLCRITQELRELQPWRPLGELGARLEALVLRGLQGSTEAQDGEALRQLMLCAHALGYRPPPDEEEDTADGAVAAKSRRGWFNLPFFSSYQQLTAGAESGGAQGNTSWSREVRQALGRALRSATEAALKVNDGPARRWLGAVLAATEPEAAQALTGNLAQIADALREAVGEEGEDARNTELLGLAASAAGSWPDADAAERGTAFGWALRLPPRQAAGTLDVLLSHARGGQALPVPCPMAEPVVVSGKASCATIRGLQVYTTRPAVLALPGLAVGPGRWFFEVEVLGHSRSGHRGALPPASAQDDEGREAPAARGRCRVGWLDQSQPQGVDLSSEASCTFEELAGGRAFRGRGIVGCALEVTPGRTEKGAPLLYFRACFALDGDWGKVKGPWRWSSDDEATSTNVRCRNWCLPQADTTALPAVSGRVVARFAVAPAHFAYGPPDASFQSVGEAGATPGLAVAPALWPQQQQPASREPQVYGRGVEETDV